MARASFQPVQPCEGTTQKPRPHFLRNRRRPPRVLVSAPICCRSPRFSRANSRRVLSSDLIVPRRPRTSSHTRGTVAAQAHVVQIIRADGVFGNHTPTRQFGRDCACRFARPPQRTLRIRGRALPDDRVQQPLSECVCPSQSKARRSRAGQCVEMPQGACARAFPFAHLQTRPASLPTRRQSEPGRRKRGAATSAGSSLSAWSWNRC
jgi:hypothetical protein